MPDEQPVFSQPPKHASELAKTLAEVHAADVFPPDVEGLPVPLVPPGVIAEEVMHEQRTRPGAGLLDAFAHLLTLVIFALFILTFLAQPFRIPSESMEPTLLVGDFVLVDKIALAPAGPWRWLLAYRQPARGQAIVFHYPMNADEFLVKRVIGVPGDHVKLVRGKVYVNDVPLAEPYAVYLPSSFDQYRDNFPSPDVMQLNENRAWAEQMHALVQNGELVVPQDEYFVMGDNRNHSLDSRYWGFVPRAAIAGTPALIYFSVRTPSPDERLLPKPQNGTMQQGSFARWDRTLRVVH